MMDWRIALRGVTRNKRRSIFTVMTLAVGAIAILLFGAFIGFLYLSFQTSAVQNSGHLQIFQKGFGDYGAADPLKYSIANYVQLMGDLRADPVMGPMIATITPTQTIFGIASNPDTGNTKTFYGSGMVREDHYRQELWNEYKLPLKFVGKPIKDADIETGDIGIGLARLLRICNGLKVPGCQAQKTADIAALDAASPFKDLLDQQPGDRAQAKNQRPNRIDLLAPTTAGAPNVISMYAVSASKMDSKSSNDSAVYIGLPLAQRLIYGRRAPAVSNIIIQLKSTSQLEAAEARMQTLIKTRNLNLEILNFMQLVPLYGQALKFLGTIFVFIAIIIGMIVLFSVINTMSMSVMERTTEIGTMRSLGASRAEITAQFVIEGLILGLLGSTIGDGLAWLISVAVNAADLKWTPPTSIDQQPLKLMLGNFPSLLIYTCLALTLLATVASVWPARRASRMEVGDALRHV